MMKGYRPEEARAAAQAGRTRRTSEVATRPPLAATAYASTRDKVCNLFSPSTHSVTFAATILHNNNFFRISFIYLGLLPKGNSRNVVLKGPCFFVRFSITP